MTLRQRNLGKYRIQRRIGEGGFSTVYRATDTIEGLQVALKIPHEELMTRGALDEFKKEVRLTASLEHPNILPLKNASMIDGVFAIAYPLGTETLASRLERRITSKAALALAEQALEGVAYAHRHRIIHCDIKPENLILFPDGRLRLSDFGIARMALRRRTLGSGQGTVGYVAPDQAVGRPSFRSDVFSLGLVLYEMFTGKLPDWPYDWPPPGIERARRNLHPDFLDLLRRCMEVDDRKRPVDGQALLDAFKRLRSRALVSGGAGRQTVRGPKKASSGTRWKDVRIREFKRLHGKHLETRHECGRCDGPISEAMLHCPWCGKDQIRFKGETRLPAHCKRCGRGAKLDWKYCAYCYGGAIHEPSERSYSDRRYSARCGSCRGDMMPFMRYCPWCRAKAKQRWNGIEKGARCGGCGWGVSAEYWDYCGWCGHDVDHR